MSLIRFFSLLIFLHSMMLLIVLHFMMIFSCWILLMLDKMPPQFPVRTTYCRPVLYRADGVDGPQEMDKI